MSPLTRSQIKGNPCILPMGIKNNTDIMENNTKISQETQPNYVVDSVILSVGIYPDALKSTYQRNVCTSMFTAIHNSHSREKLKASVDEVDNMKICHL